MSKTSDATETNAAPSLKPNVQALSDKIVAGLSLNKTDGLITEEKSSYIDNLPEGITPEVEETLGKYRTEYIAASAHATGVVAVQGMASNKKLDQVSSEMKMGHDIVRHTVHRSKEYKYVSGTEQKSVVKPGAIQTEIDIKGGRASGQLAVARKSIGALAAEKLAGKK